MTTNAETGAARLIEAIKWAPPPGRRMRADSLWAPLWLEVIRTSIETGKAAYLPAGTLPSATPPHGVSKLVHDFARRHPEHLRDRGYCVHTRTTEDGGLAVWAAPLDKPAKRA